MSRHPAHLMPFDELLAGLRDAVSRKLVFERTAGDLSLFNYTPAAVYDRQWTPFTLVARGIIVCHRQRRIVATSLPKFFNLSERPDDPLPDLPFEAFTKEDGSLIIVFHDGECWRTATRGSFDSAQAVAAHRWLHERDTDSLTPGHTYLAEWVGPDNRIVVPYERRELILLAVYDRDGYEHAYPLVLHSAEALGWRVAERHAFASLRDLVEHSSTLPATAEGFVVRYTNGHRIKIKGDEYRRIHALISRCTPLAMWEAMLAGDDMEKIRSQLPEEFWGDFDGITRVIQERIDAIADQVTAAAASMAGWSDKEVGLHLTDLPEPVRRLIFPYRKSGTILSGKPRETLFRMIRPTGNMLPGYTPSYAMHRVQEESL